MYFWKYFGWFTKYNFYCWFIINESYNHGSEFAAECETIANHGSEFKYDHIKVGVNSRLDVIQAAILRVKLENLSEYNQARREAASRYDELLKDATGITIPQRDSRSSHVFHQYTIQIDPFYIDNATIQKELAKSNIPSAIYYPKPIHLQNAYNWLDYREGDFPVSEKLSKTVLSLPMHTELCAEQQEYIADRLIAAIKKWI